MFRWIAIALLFVSVCATAQPVHRFFRMYSTRDGLPSNSCNVIAEDKNGFMWIGTAEGLSRFDGHHFSNFFHIPKDSTSLAGNHITTLDVAQNGDVWIGTQGNGISCFKNDKQIFQTYILENDAYPFTKNNRVNGVYVMQNNAIIVASEGGIFIKENDAVKFQLIHPSALQLEIEQLGICQIKRAHNADSFWITYGGKLIYFKPKENIAYHSSNNPLNWKIFENGTGKIPTTDQYGSCWFTDEENQNICSFNANSNSITIECPQSTIQSQSIQKLVYDPCSHELLVSSWQNPAFIINCSNKKIDRTPFTLNYPGSVGDVMVLGCVCDSRNIRWIATSKGLFAEQPKTSRNKSLNWISHEKASSVINHLIEVDSLLWIATKEGLQIYDIKSQTFLSQNFNDILKSHVNYLFYDQIENLIFVCTPQAIHQISPSTKAIKLYKDYSDTTAFSNSKNAIQFIHRDKQNRIWIGSWGGNLCCFNGFFGPLLYHFNATKKDTLYPRSGLLCMYESEEELFVGFNGGDGLWKWSQELERFQPLWTSNNNKEFNGVVDDLLAMPNGQFYLATFGNGLCIWNAIDKSSKYLSRANGMPGDYVYRIEKINDEKILAVTNNGVCTIRLSDLHVEMISQDFVQPYPLFSFSGFNANPTNWWFFHQQYFYHIQLEDKITAAITPVLTGLQIMGSPYSWNTTTALELPWNQNFIRYEFSALPFLHEDKIEYAYQLIGVDADWNYSGNVNFATYTDLQGGQYNFLVKSRLGNGDWSDTLQLTTIIHPPFWKTWWFRTLMAALILLSLYTIYRYRLSQVLKMHAVRNSISNDLHDDIGASLSSIRIYSKVASEKLHENPIEALRVLKKINADATDVMENMSDIVWSIHPGNDNLESLTNRIKIHSIEVLQSIGIECELHNHFTDDISLNMKARKNIYLIVKESVNNVAKHSKASICIIDFQKSNNALAIRIEDNGKSEFSESNKGGNGLRSMTARAEEIGGHFQMKQASGSGTIIEVNIPITRISDRNDLSDSPTCNKFHHEKN
jgi:hypothetical protein